MSHGQSSELALPYRIAVLCSWYSDQHASSLRKTNTYLRNFSVPRSCAQLNTSGARVRLVVIEASRRNPYERRFRTYSPGLAPIKKSENALILSSAAPGQVVEDSDELHSQLMTALLTQMDFSKGIEEVFNNTRNAVVAATQGQQIPAVSSTLTESVNLWPARSGALPCPPSALQLAVAASDQTDFC